MPVRDAPSLTMTDAIPKPLLWALVASAAVHSAFVFMPRAWPSHGSDAVVDHGVLLQAALVAPSEQQTDVTTDHPPELTAPASPSPIQLADQALATPSDPRTVPPMPAVSAASAKNPPSLSIGGAADMQIDGQLLEDRSRLGDMLSRQLSEFPVEVDFPVRLKDKIHAKYPATALAAGREESVAVWVVVDAQGVPEEILIADGSEEFAEAVVAAVKDARFVPARNNLLPIRFPISLEFHFVLGTPAATAVTR